MTKGRISGACKGKKINKPWRTPSASKKSAVCVKDGGSTKVVRFGDQNMTIKKSNPKRRKAFHDRFNCESPGPKTSARYWSCKAW